MTPVAILGTGGHAMVVREALELASLAGDEWNQWRALGCFGDETERNIPRDALLALGMGRRSIRKEVADKYRDRKFATVIHPKAIVSGQAQIDEGAQIMAGAIIQAGSFIGRHAIINTGAQVDHGCRIGEFAHICPGAILCADVTVHAGAMVEPGQVVHRGAVITRNGLMDEEAARAIR